MDDTVFEKKFQELKHALLENLAIIPGDLEIAQTLRDCQGSVSQAYEELSYSPQVKQVPQILHPNSRDNPEEFWNLDL